LQESSTQCFRWNSFDVKRFNWADPAYPSFSCNENVHMNLFTIKALLMFVHKGGHIIRGGGYVFCNNCSFDTMMLDEGHESKIHRHHL